MADTNPSQSSARVPHWVKLLLILSLALNLLVLGIVGGTVWRFSNGPSYDSPRSEFAFVTALDRPQRRAVLKELRGRYERKTWWEGKEKMVAVLQILRAESFDRSALDAAMQSKIDHGREMQLNIHEVWLDQISNMSTAERRDYADRLEDRLNRGRKSKHDYRKH